MAPKAKATAKAAATKQPRVRDAASKTKAREIYADVAAASGVTIGQAKSVLDALRQAASRELGAKGAFVIPNLVLLKLLHKKPADAKVKAMFGKEVHIAARPATIQVKAMAPKHMQDGLTGIAATE